MAITRASSAAYIYTRSRGLLAVQGSAAAGKALMNISCYSEKEICYRQNSNLLAILCLQYWEVKCSWQNQIIIFAVALFFNLAVIVWRLKHWFSGNHVALSSSLLIVNLATADGAFAVSRIMGLAAIRATRNWSQEATPLTEHLCTTSFLTRHFSVILSALIMTVVALSAIRQSVGLCGLPKRISPSTVRNILFVFWAIGVSVALTYYFFADVTIQPRNEADVETINWVTCWVIFPIRGHHSEVVNIILATMLAILILVILASYAYAFFLIKKYRFESHQSITLVEFQLVAIVFIDGILLIFLLAWNMYLLAKNVKKLTPMTEVEIVVDTVGVYILSAVALINPLMYTFLTKELLKRLTCRRRTNEPELSLIQETSLFPDSQNSSDSTTYGSLNSTVACVFS